MERCHRGLGAYPNTEITKSAKASNTSGNIQIRRMKLGPSMSRRVKCEYSSKRNLSIFERESAGVFRRDAVGIFQTDIVGVFERKKGYHSKRKGFFKEKVVHSKESEGIFQLKCKQCNSLTSLAF